ncbi:hypothetical protein ACETU7_17910 [Rhodococcus sp. 3Y1]
MAPPLIELSGITKSYGPVKSLQGVDLRLAKGEVLRWSATTAPVSPL